MHRGVGYPRCEAGHLQTAHTHEGVDGGAENSCKAGFEGGVGMVVCEAAT